MSGASGPADPLPAGLSGLKLDLDDQVTAAWNALSGVYDPELYLDVVSLGLVYGVRKENGAIVVEMTMTTPGCPASEILPDMAREAIAGAVGGTAAVDVRVVWDPPWSPAMMDDSAAAELGFRVR
ncbi:MAG: metal-sulfur cluster assembly factor [Streptosporangiaceae bacterium]